MNHLYACVNDAIFTTEPEIETYLERAVVENKSGFLLLYNDNDEILSIIYKLIEDETIQNIFQETCIL